MTEPIAPLVSVVTPVYNGEKHLSECIESVLGQTLADFEYVVLDNASTDSTPAILDEYASRDSRIRVHRNDDTLPYIRNWNRAVSLMHEASRYCKIVHADDWLMEDCLQDMVELGERHPVAGIIGSWIQRGDEVMAKWDGAPGELLAGREVGRASLMAEIPYLFGSPSALLLRSDIVRSRENLYPEVDHPLVDQQLCYELLEHTDFGYVQRVLSFNRIHGGSITASQEETNEWFTGKLTLLASFGTVYLSDTERLERIDHYLDRYYRFLARQVGRWRGADFWSFHAGALEDLGLPLDRSRLWRAALREAPGRLRRSVRRQGSR